MGYIKVVCAWGCGKLLGYRPAGRPEDTGQVSHSICPACYAVAFKGIPVTPDMVAEWRALADSLERGQQ